MTVRLFSGGRECFVSPFIARFIANVCRAVAGSLKAPPAQGRIEFVLQEGRVELRVDGVTVPLDGRQGFASSIVEDTLRGLVRRLKEVDPEGPLRVEVEI
jgi:hypothetical protein